MLAQRVATAVVLLALLLPSLVLDAAWPFQALTLALIAAAAWEWARLSGWRSGSAVATAAALAVAGVAALSFDLASRVPPLAWWLPGAIWLVGGPLALALGPGGWARGSPALRGTAGPVLLFVAWLALAEAKLIGVNFLLSVFVLVWVSDIAAYAGGRLLGRRKLAPTISPGKTWEGVASGVLAVGVVALAWWALDRLVEADSASLYTRLVAHLGWGGSAIAVAALVGMGVVGDLVESMIKRAAGVKDSSGLLPGHGGVLDRIDALLPVFPLALALALSLAGG